jgi:hypothetical protein
MTRRRFIRLAGTAKSISMYREPVWRREVLAGAGPRRSWSAGEKATSIAESYSAARRSVVSRGVTV